MENADKLYKIIDDAAIGGYLKKITLSRSNDKRTVRAEGRLILIKGEPYCQIETFLADGKALHTNIPCAETAKAVLEMTSQYRQINIMTSGGNCEVRVSSKGKLALFGNLAPRGESISPKSHDREKNHILFEGTVYPFLVLLGVTDENGKIFDKKRAKYRQIDRFLQYINDIYPKLPKEGELYVLDLCCGKSYLSFAAHWFLTEVKGRALTMVGADRKEDVIAFCSDTASKLGCKGLSFLCCDILKFVPEREPDLVLSLHACDIATDIVLTTAAKFGARVILSTPCCHHQVADQLNESSVMGAQLEPILKHSLLKQKLAVALTDALRCKRLEAAGYSVDVTELIDPENTPKNLMIRAVRVAMSEGDKNRHLKEFQALEELCGVCIFNPYL